ncbi:MAG: ATP-binding cassette domain-containing protein [Acidimicrobiales bacterium]
MTKPIEVQGLVRKFGSLTAVDGIDLVVEPGEIFGFLGPNGAGKSTTVRMLVTLLRPTGGVAKVAGFDVVADAARVRQSIGVALQDAALDPLMTGRELLRLQGLLHGINRGDADKRGEELLDRVGLTAAADRRVGTYSGGMRRRLDLAMALVHRPSVLFLDEPTTGLDPMSRISLWEEVRSLNADHGTTVFLTTQYLEEADQLAGRIAIIDHGKLVREGSPAALKAEVGAPTLYVQVDPDEVQAATDALTSLGEIVPAPKGRVGVRLPGGAVDMPQVVRALDGAKIVAEAMELHAPSLDDVFADATGRRLEGAEDSASASAAPDAAGAAETGLRRRRRRR